MSYRTFGCLGRKECWGVGVEVGRTVARARVKAVTLEGTHLRFLLQGESTGWADGLNVGVREGEK